MRFNCSKHQFKQRVIEMNPLHIPRRDRVNRRKLSGDFCHLSNKEPDVFEMVALRNRPGC